MLSIKMLSAIMLSVMILSVVRLNVNMLIVALSRWHHNYAECFYIERHLYSVIILIVDMLTANMMSVFTPNVVAPTSVCVPNLGHHHDIFVLL